MSANDRPPEPGLAGREVKREGARRSRKGGPGEGNLWFTSRTNNPKLGLIAEKRISVTVSSLETARV